MGRLAFVFMVLSFATTTFAMIRSIYLTAIILRLLREIDPKQAEKLTGGRVPLLGKLMWVDPISFAIFAHSRGPRDERLEPRVRQLRRIELLIALSWAGFMVSMFLLQPGTS
jgi:hypothetical protein